MKTKKTKASNPDPRFPTPEEQALIAQGVFISKLKYNDQNIQPSYHQWKDVWADNLRYTIDGNNQDQIWRAVAISLPMYFLDQADVEEFTYRAYVYGIVVQTGAGGQTIELSKVIWKK